MFDAIIGWIERTAVRAALRRLAEVDRCLAALPSETATARQGLAWQEIRDACAADIGHAETMIKFGRLSPRDRDELAQASRALRGLSRKLIGRKFARASTPA